MNPRTPVLVGAAQVLNRLEGLEDAKEPLEMMTAAILLAEKDTGVGNVLAQAQSVRVVRGMWGYENPAKLLAERIGTVGAESIGTLIGGNQNQVVINETASAILHEGLDLAVITGAENGNSAGKARKAGVTLTETPAPGKYDRVIGAKQQPEHHEFERAQGIMRAIQIYPMYDNAIRHARGESIDQHAERVSALWSRFNDVAQRNPNAWVQHNMTAEEIRTPSQTNRRISFPYTKFMNANMSVNMGAALIMCSAFKAKSLGIPKDRWVYPYAGVVGHDHFSASVRDNFYSSPGIRMIGRRLLELTDMTVDELDFVDLYSCFPSAVQIAAMEYGLDEKSDLTVTGGLTFGGGPLNNYVMHSVARTVELLREKQGARALITANGGNLYKHAHGIYGSEAPSHDFTVENVQDDIDALPPRQCLAKFVGNAIIESYTVMFSGDDPTVGHLACRTGDDTRTWVNTQDSDIMNAMLVEEFCGRPVHIKGPNELTVLS